MENLQIKKTGLMVCAIALAIALGFLCYLVSAQSLNSAYDLSLGFSVGKAIACYVVALLLIFFAPIPSEVSAVMKLRIALVMTLGGLVIGYFAWPLVAPENEMGIVSFHTGQISFAKAGMLLLVSFLTGALASLLAIPYGRETGAVAVPMGLCICATRSGLLTSQLSLLESAEQVHSVYAVLRWEGAYWLLLVVAGILGATLMQRFSAPKPVHHQQTGKGGVVVLSPLLVSIVVGFVGVSFLGVCSRVFDKQFFTVIHQPYNGQVAFAVFITFVVAGFLCRHYLKASYIYPLATTALVSFIFAVVAGRVSYLEYMISNHPAQFVAYPFAAMLPIQIVSFGGIGSVTGYWMSYLASKRLQAVEV